jgi:glycoprotein endo-alpha-1,2-mannosidase
MIRKAWVAMMIGTATLAADEPLPQTPLMQQSPKAVFVATMGDFKTPAVTGSWKSWNHKPHDPDKLDDKGRPDLASVYTPAIGPYDMSDPVLIEEHCQLIKMAGIDGISFNLNFLDEWRLKSMKLYVDTMKRHGLTGIIRFEDKYHYDRFPSRDKAIEAIHADMNAWLKLFEPIQFKVAGRPLFMLFTFKQTPAELEAWKNSFPRESQPLILTRNTGPEWKNVVDGTYDWCGLDPKSRDDHPPFRAYADRNVIEQNLGENLRRAAERLKSGLIQFHLFGASPGFDDTGCNGWGEGPRKVERDDGNTYRYRWDQALASGLPIVLIPTWNDWMEGTVIEPSVEFGTKYLELTREYAAKHKNQTLPTANFRVPEWIYKIRKSTQDAGALKAMTEASDHIAAGRYVEAEALVKPLAEKFKVMDEGYWQPKK